MSGSASPSSAPQVAAALDGGATILSNLSTPQVSSAKHSGVSRYGSGGSTSGAVADKEETGDCGVYDGKSQGVSGHSRVAQEARTSRLQRKSSEKHIETCPHTVTFTVSIAFAIPSSDKDDVSPAGKANGKQIYSRKGIEASRAQAYYNFEYKLLPGDTEATKVDIVLFGAVAKLYMDNESKILKPWKENGKKWLLWSRSVELCVTSDVLLKALTHQIHVKIWDAKEKVSPKARFDKPKGFKVLQGKEAEEAEAEIKEFIVNQRKVYEDSRPRTSFIHQNNDNVLSAHDGVVSSHALDRSPKLPAAPPLVPGSSSPPLKPSLKGSTTINMENGKTSATSQTDLLDMEANFQKFRIHTGKPAKEVKSDVTSKDTKKAKQGRKREKAASDTPLPTERKCLALRLSFMPFLAGDLSVTDRLQETSDTILDAYVTLAINPALLSEEQRKDLNPLVLRILSATSLPTSPTPISVLKEKCAPVYCRYTFHKQPPHQTHGQEHGTHVYFQDANVILAGAINPGELWDFLRGPPLEIEVHDRDRKIEDSASKPSLFGNEPEDEKLSNVGFVTSKRTVHNPFTKRGRLWHPYGIAKVNLSDLLHGATYVNMSIPIQSCEAPDPLGRDTDLKSGKLTGVLGSVDGPQEPSLPMGNYLEAQSLLKVRVDIAVPLTVASKASGCPYGRIIYIFDYNNRRLLHDALRLITLINARAFNLEANPLDAIQDALSKKCLADYQPEDPSLDVITGIHIMDGTMHLFILEGLKDQAIKKLWETLPSRATEAEHGKLEILYNSEMAFCERLYTNLSALLFQVHLHQPLSAIVKQPLLYIRDMLPAPGFQAVSRLDYICNAKKLRDVVHGDLLPSVEMINMLSREFGIPVNLGDLFAGSDRPSSKYQEDTNSLCVKKRWLQSRLNNYNAHYVHWKRTMESQEFGNKDYIQSNIDRVYQMSGKVKTPKVKVTELFPDDGGGAAVYNYSSQALNATERAKRILRKQMAENPKQRFTYCQNYQWATVSPVGTESELNKETTKPRWMTPNGLKSSTESNEHPKNPDSARVVELTKAWKENVLNANILQPTLARERWSWTLRHMDFDLYHKPPRRSASAPVTIHLAGDSLQVEQKAAAQEEKMKWLQKIQVADLTMRFYRCLPGTELTWQGPQASDQQRKLLGLLKDQPAKLSLRKEGIALEPIPALAVVQNSGVNVNYIGANNDKVITSGFVPGEEDKHSWTWSGNAIPCHTEHPGGEAFHLHSSEHSFIYKRGIKELSQEGKAAILCTRPNKGEELPPINVKFHRSGNLLHTQTFNGFTVQIQ